METIGLSNSLTIASIGITFISIVISVVLVVFALRRRKYPGSIMFIREEPIALLDDFATRLPNLEVSYNNAPIDKNLVLLRGYLLNDGNIDIRPDMTEQPLTVTLPDGCTWLEFTLTGTAENLHAEGKIVSPTILQIAFAGQFRRDEAFSFQALVTVDAEKYAEKPSSLAKELRWSHRIANFGTVKTAIIPILEMASRSTWFKTVKLLFFIMMNAVLGLVCIVVLFFAKNPVIDYEYEINNQKTIISLTPEWNGSVTMTDLATGNKQRVDLQKLATTLKPIYQKRYTMDGEIILVCLVVFLSGMTLLMLNAMGFRQYRMRKKLLAAVARKPRLGEGGQQKT